VGNHPATSLTTWYPVFTSVTLVALLLVLFIRGHWRSDWSRRRIRKAFSEMDSIDEREGADQEYEGPMALLRQGLPGWAATDALKRLALSDGPSRRRHLEILSQSDLSSFRERLVDLARDSSDPLAADIWEMLTGRPRSQWSQALIDTDGKAGFADPPRPESGPWLGYYVQLGAEHRMDFTLAIEGNSFHGEGQDIVGPFSIAGEFSKGEIQAEKRYSSHSVRYVGRLEGDTMAGHWSLVGGSGKFRLWPRRQKVLPATGGKPAGPL
jgi:hypothetical protein